MRYLKLEKLSNLKAWIIMVDTQPKCIVDDEIKVGIFNFKTSEGRMLNNNSKKEYKNIQTLERSITKKYSIQMGIPFRDYENLIKEGKEIQKQEKEKEECENMLRVVEKMYKQSIIVKTSKNEQKFITSYLNSLMNAKYTQSLDKHSIFSVKNIEDIKALINHSLITKKGKNMLKRVLNRIIKQIKFEGMSIRHDSKKIEEILK